MTASGPTRAFYGCSGLTSVTIGNSVTSIGWKAFDGCILPEVISMIENPCNIGENTFSDKTFYDATLYVPSGTNEKYKAREGWKKFAFIEEGNGSDNSPESKKCEKPTITYLNRKVRFSCETEGVEFVPSVTCTLKQLQNGNELELEVTYTICVYAVKDGYDNSDTATMTINLSPR